MTAGISVMSSNGAAQAVAASVHNDPELKRLRRELAETMEELKKAEKRIPENVRDLESIALYVQKELRGESEEFLQSFMRYCLPLRAYADLLDRKNDLEKEIDARLEELISSDDVC